MQIVKLTQSEAEKMLEDAKVQNRMSKDLMDALKKNGWKFSDYAMERKVKGIYIAVEFCMGDFCVGVYSKKGKWILENKISCPSFARALTQAVMYESQIKGGKHWKGENN